VISKRETRRRLRHLEPRENPEAKARALTLARREIEGRDLEAAENPRPWARAARILLVAAAVGGFLLTAPGRGLADRLGELVGIGDEPTAAPVFTNPGMPAEQVVIGVGGGSEDIPGYEVIASRIEETDGEAPLCFRVSFPELEQRGVLQCLTDAALSNLTPETMQPAAFVLKGVDQVVVVGIVGSGVQKVLAGPAEADAEIYRPSSDLLKPDPGGAGAGYFVAFSETAHADPSPIRVSSSGSDGRRLSTTVTAVSTRP
jgi:hypothetical protein